MTGRDTCNGDGAGGAAQAAGTFQHPSDGVTELVFDVCAFGCAGTGGS